MNSIVNSPLPVGVEKTKLIWNQTTITLIRHEIIRKFIGSFEIVFKKKEFPIFLFISNEYIIFVYIFDSLFVSPSFAYWKQKTLASTSAPCVSCI